VRSLLSVKAFSCPNGAIIQPSPDGACCSCFRVCVCVQALLMLAAQLQCVTQPDGNMLLMREACYRCIGEGYNHVCPHFSFHTW
jgi:hypothetical protein